MEYPCPNNSAYLCLVENLDLFTIVPTAGIEEVVIYNLTANDLVAPTACLEAINMHKWPPPVPLLCVY